MSNPTIGTLDLSNGMQIEHVNTAACWSDDSRYLAVPQWRFFFGLQLRQRILVLDVPEKAIFASRPLGWFIQPRSFSGGLLVVDVEPTRKSARQVQFGIPSDLVERFRRLS